MVDKAILKYNNSEGALLCSKCSIIIKTGKEFTIEEQKALIGELSLEPQYCPKCKQINNEKEKTNNQVI